MTNIILGYFGSILVNYLADVLPVQRKLVRPYCHECQHEKSWKDYLLPAACEQCGARASGRHLIVLILGPVLAGMLYLFPIENLGNYGAIVWLVYFGLVVIIDLEYQLILHPVSLVGALLGILFGSLSHEVDKTLLGGAAGFGIMLIFYYMGDFFVRVLSKSRGEEITEVALGFGDVNLAGIIGFLLGWPGVLLGIFIAIILGGVTSGLFMIIQLVRKRYQAFQALPYGPFLVLSVVVTFYLSQIL